MRILRQRFNEFESGGWGGSTRETSEGAEMRKQAERDAARRNEKKERRKTARKSPGEAPQDD